MIGHTRPRSLTGLVAARHAAEVARYRAEVRAEVERLLSERRYRLLSLNYLAGSGTWALRFCAAEGDDEEHQTFERGAQALYDHIRIYPVRVPRAPWVNGAALTVAFLRAARQGFQALAGFARP